MSLTRRLLCLVLAVNLAFFGAPLSLSAQEDPGPGDQTTPAPTDPEKPPAPPEGGEKPPELAPPVAEPVPEAEVGQQGINGQLLDLDGTTPIPNEEVRIVDKDGTAVVKVVSGPDGKFVLPVLKDGDYVLETRGVRQPFQVKPDQPIKELKVLVPAAAFQPAGPAPTSDDDNTGTILIFVGVGAAVIVAGLATGLAIGLSGDDEDDKFVGPASNEPPTTFATPAQAPPEGPQPAFAFSKTTTGEFGTVSFGETKIKEVKVRNGTAFTQTYRGDVTGAGLSIILPSGANGTTQTIIVPPFSEATFFVSFTGTTVGPFSGAFTVTTSGNTSERAAVREGGMLTLPIGGTVDPGGPPSSLNP